MKTWVGYFIAMSLALASAAGVQAATGMTSMEDLVAHRLLAMPSDRLFDNPAVARLADAVGSGDIKSAQQWVERGADVNAVGKRGMTLLLWALGKRNVNGFGFLLEHGANANAVTCCDEAAAGSVHQLSAMGLAARVESPDYLRELLAHGGNPNLVVSELSETPIFYTLLDRRIENARILIKAGADLNHTTSGSMMTPMARAAGQTDYEMALLFLRAGADPTIRNRWGRTAIDDTMKYGRRALGVLNNPADAAAYAEFVTEIEHRKH